LFFLSKIYGIPQSCCPCFPHDLVQILMLSTSVYLSHQHVFVLLNILLFSYLKSWNNLFFSNLCQLVVIGGLFVVVSCHVTYSAATEPRTSCVLAACCATRGALVLGYMVVTSYKSLSMFYLNLIWSSVLISQHTSIS
jgi:hypothetical protein